MTEILNRPVLAMANGKKGEKNNWVHNFCHLLVFKGRLAYDSI